jgi:hypothetical protein
MSIGQPALADFAMAVPTLPRRQEAAGSGLLLIILQRTGRAIRKAGKEYS